jgi:peptide/nickel transport system ATP-binding protein
MLLRTLQAERGFATILISHDAAVVNFMADRVAMMEGGRITSIRNRHETLT